MTSKSRTVYLVRHGIAADRGPAWPDDALRPLTPKGVARMRLIVRRLRQLEVKVDVVLTSPLVRAKQTAELLVGGLEPAPAMTVVAALSPNIAPAKMAETLTGFKRSQVIAIVGHEPGLGELASWFLGTHAPLPFKKGGVCRIDLPASSPNGSGQLIWFATPRLLRGVK